MRTKLLITGLALTLPLGSVLAQSAGAQPAPPQQATAPAEPAPDAKAAAPATAADLTAGAKVSDSTGQTVGTIDSVNDKGVVLAMGTLRIQVPPAAIVKSDAGLVVSATKSELESAAKKPAK